MARDNPEERLQCAVVQHLHLAALPGVVWFHVPNGEYRSKRTAARLKALGVRPGVADLVFHVDGEFRAMEIKAPKGRQSAAQLVFQKTVEQSGGEYVVADNIERALAALVGWRVLPPEYLPKGWIF